MQTPWIARDINKWYPRSNQPELSLEAKMLKLKLLYFGCIMRRQNSLEKTIMLGKVEGSKKRGTANMRWTDSLNSTG